MTIKIVEEITAPNNGLVVLVLERMLEEAKEGRIDGIAVVTSDSKGYTYSNYEIGINTAILLGGMQRLAHRILQNEREDEDE